MKYREFDTLDTRILTLYSHDNYFFSLTIYVFIDLFAFAMSIHREIQHYQNMSILHMRMNRAEPERHVGFSQSHRIVHFHCDRPGSKLASVNQSSVIIRMDPSQIFLGDPSREADFSTISSLHDDWLINGFHVPKVFDCGHFSTTLTMILIWEFI